MGAVPGRLNCGTEAPKLDARIRIFESSKSIMVQQASGKTAIYFAKIKSGACVVQGE